MSGYDEIFVRFGLLPDLYEDRMKAIEIWLNGENEMANLGMTFDSSQVEPQGEYTPLPVGEYRVQILESEVKSTKDGGGQFLELQMQVLDGEYTNRRIWERLNLWNNNAQAVEIAQRTLSAICRAVGVPSVDDSEALHMIPFIAKARLVPDKRNPGSFQNAFTYKSENEAEEQQPAKAAAPAARPAARSAPAAAAKPAAPGAGQKPWERAKARA